MVREVWTRMTNKAARDLLLGKADLVRDYYDALMISIMIIDPLVAPKALQGCQRSSARVEKIVLMLIIHGYTKDWFAEEILAATDTISFIR